MGPTFTNINSNSRILWIGNDTGKIIVIFISVIISCFEVKFQYFFVFVAFFSFLPKNKRNLRNYPAVSSKLYSSTKNYNGKVQEGNGRGGPLQFSKLLSETLFGKPAKAFYSLILGSVVAASLSVGSPSWLTAAPACTQLPNLSWSFMCFTFIS